MRSERFTKVDGQYRIGSPLLLLFSTPFIVWQMGVLFYADNTLSLFGRTSILPVNSHTMAVIAAGYIASIAMLCLLPRKAVWMQRVILPAAFAATLGMLFPVSRQALTALFCIAAFCCVFSIGTMVSIAAQHFTVDTVWRDGIISMLAGGVLIAILQNDMFRPSFTAFTVLSLPLIAAQTVFYFLIPADIEVPYARREDRAAMPGVLFAGLWLISGFATLLICFASSYAESVTGGLSTIYLSAAVMAALLFLLRRKLGAKSIRLFGGFFALSVFGFVLAFLSLHIPGLQIVACILLGFVVVLANLWIFFAAAAFHVYPTRYIGVIGAGMGLVLAAFHAGLQDALRNSLPLLYGIYAALSVALLLVYYFMEPYFTRMWNMKSAPPSARASARLTAVNDAAAAPSPFDGLSEQERILAELILDGHTETSAAKSMNISLNTQKGYRKNLYSKLGIHSRRELFALAEKR